MTLSTLLCYADVACVLCVFVVYCFRLLPSFNYFLYRSQRLETAKLIKQLNDMLPYASCHHLRIPRIVTLRKACEYIVSLKEENAALKSKQNGRGTENEKFVLSTLNEETFES